MPEPAMSPASVTARLLELNECSRRLRATRSVDMSARAIDTRLRALGSLHRACLALVAAGRRAGLGVGQPPSVRTGR
ncbi:MAG: hypothetical protein KF718_01295 [Polyangiaceae bacterium]|nr:hypothetical protein [Polyangiaceae bacterium]